MQVLVFICLMLARFGNDGDIMRFARNSFGSDLTFMGIGTLVGYAIIVPSILCTYLMGANLTFLVRKNLKVDHLVISNLFFFYRNCSSILWVEFYSFWLELLLSWKLGKVIKTMLRWPLESFALLLESSSWLISLFRLEIVELLWCAPPVQLYKKGS